MNSSNFNNRHKNFKYNNKSPSTDEKNPCKTGETLITINRYRITSAEMISEAKKYLNKMTTQGPSPNPMPANVAGVQVINTKRPITPRESGRSLYGKVSLAGRPPSAFSMKYLQNENPSLAGHRAHTLEPISQHSNEKLNESLSVSNIRRSQSWELNPKNLLLDRNCGLTGSRRSLLPHKLPSLQLKGKSFNRLDPITSVPEETIRPRTVSLDEEYVNEFTNNSSHDSFQTIDGLLEILQQHRGIKECASHENLKRINAILMELYDRVNGRERYFRQPAILGALYGLVECDSPNVLLGIARVILALRVTGSNLAGACKLVFKVAKSAENDNLFHKNDVLELLIDGLGRASPLEDPEVCIYGYGAIRFLTCNTKKERDELNDDVNNSVRSLENSILPPKPSTAPSSFQEFDLKNQSLSSSTKMINNNEFYNRTRKLNEQNNLVTRLAKHGAIQLIILHLQILNEFGAIRRLSGLPLHSLYQLSATLRSLADIRCYYADSLDDLKQLSQDNSDTQSDTISNESKNSIQLELACPHLVKAAEITLNEIEIQANIIRTLSVLSDDEDCCRVLAKFAPRIGILLAPCCTNLLHNKSSEKSLSLVSRLGYILGNIMAKYNNARLQFFQNDVAMEYLQRVLEIYSKLPLNLHNSLGDTVIDALVKIIRVVANMSVNAEVGMALGRNDPLQLIFLQLLKATSSTSLPPAPFSSPATIGFLDQAKQLQLKLDLNELFHVILGALHNLFFYQDEIEESQYCSKSNTTFNDSIRGKIALNLCLALKNHSQDNSDKTNLLQLEIIRVLGNLTRNPMARKQLCEANGIEIILQLLQRIQSIIDQEQNEFKACIIGILINVLGDTDNRLAFGQSKGVQILIEVLRDALESYPDQDWFLASIICQAFWNLYNDTTHFNALCSINNHLDELIKLLMKFIDEEKFITSINIEKQQLTPSSLNSEENLINWQNFTMVATDLLEHLQNFLNHSSLNNRAEIDKESYKSQDNDYN